MISHVQTDLLPLPLRVHAGRRRAMRGWCAVLGAATTMVSVAVGIAGTIDPSEMPVLLVARDEATASMQRVAEMLDERKLELGDARLEARLRERLIDRPDWSLLLSLIGRVSHETATLTVLRLEPDGAGYESRFVGEVPYRLTLIGDTSTTAEVSELVLGLVDSGVFRSVDLERTARAGDGPDARYVFEIVCTLGAERAGVTP